MKPIWIIDGEDVTRLQGDAAGFVRLLNALLSTAAAWEGSWMLPCT